MFKRFFKKIPKEEEKLEIEVSREVDTDIVSYIRRRPSVFAELENQYLNKPKAEVLREIEIGLKILDLKLGKSFSISEDIVIVPPKYEFWVYFFLAIRLVLSGKKIKLLYYKWTTEIIAKIEPGLKYLSYQNLSLTNIDDFNFNPSDKFQIINFSESFRGIKSNVPSFSTAFITEHADLDYAAAYITEHAFTFAGLKKSNIKRILVDTSIYDTFTNKLKQRLNSDALKNRSTIKSSKLTDDLHQLISETISDGADVLVGDGILTNEESPSNIILTDVNPNMRIYQKKFFGPVLLISRIDINSEDFQKYLKVQPSQGIVIFDLEKSEISKFNLPKELFYAVRSIQNVQDEFDILNEHPSLEYVMKSMKF